MGIDYIIIAIVAIGFFVAGIATHRIYTNNKTWGEVKDINALDRTFDQIGFDFLFMIDRLKNMSVKAQATFAYQYTQMLRNAGNRRMIATVKRYLEMAEIKNPDTVAKARGKAL